jgi:ATP-dependent Clp protease ATP-binding subunit ClpA
MSQYPFEQFTVEAKRALALAQQEAERDRRGYVGTEHILLGLMLLGSGSAHRALADFNVDAVSVRNTIKTTLARAKASSVEPTIRGAPTRRAIETAFVQSRPTRIGRALAWARLSLVKPVIPTSRVKRTVELAFEQSRRMGTDQVHSGHLLIGLAIEGQGIGAIVMKDFGATTDRIVDAVERELGVTSSGTDAESQNSPDDRPE